MTSLPPGDLGAQNRPRPCRVRWGEPWAGGLVLKVRGVGRWACLQRNQCAPRCRDWRQDALSIHGSAHGDSS